MPDRGPTTLRSPRSRAIDIGTNPAGFSEAPNYDAQGGHPVEPGMPSGTYVEQPPAVTESGPGPIEADTPFRLGG